MPASFATLHALKIAVTWGTPTPDTIRVVQIDPGPIPTFTASAPASIKSRAPSSVAMLPATTSMSNFSLIARTVWATFALWPWALSTVITSTSACTKAATRSIWCTPTAAPTRKRPRSSRQASGNWSCLAMSPIVISPVRQPASSISSSFSTLLPFKIASACSSVVSDPAVTNRSLVITSLTGVASSPKNIMSRRVTMPTTSPRAVPSTVIGTPEMLCSRISVRTSDEGALGGSVTGSAITPLAERLTFTTSRTWSSTDRFLWITPSPPCCASAIANAASVTVSIGDERIGIFSVILRVSRDETSVSLGTTSLRAGISSTSSNVMPSEIILASMDHI